MQWFGARTWQSEEHEFLARRTVSTRDMVKSDQTTGRSSGNQESFLSFPFLLLSA